MVAALAATVNEYLKGNRTRKRRKRANSSICRFHSAIQSISMIQTHERFKRTFFIRTKHNMQTDCHAKILPSTGQENNTAEPKTCGCLTRRKAQYNTIQLYCLCVEKFAFWLVIYIKTLNTVNNKTSTTQ